MTNFKTLPDNKWISVNADNLNEFLIYYPEELFNKTTPTLLANVISESLGLSYKTFQCQEYGVDTYVVTLTR